MNALLKMLKRTYPEAKCSLDYATPYQLLAATVLSAQCTDERVNKVTPALFKKFPDAKAMAKGKISEIEELIRTTGFFKSKAKSLSESAKALVELYDGVVPREMDQLVALRGVGRKTANVVLGNAFDIQAGVVVDTHVGRLSRRMGFTKHTDAVKIEKDLEKIVPRKDWTIFPLLMIYHGRARCIARSPDCGSCEYRDECPKKGVDYKTAPKRVLGSTMRGHVQR